MVLPDDEEVDPLADECGSPKKEEDTLAGASGSQKKAGNPLCDESGDRKKEGDRAILPPYRTVPRKLGAFRMSRQNTRAGGSFCYIIIRDV